LVKLEPGDPEWQKRDLLRTGDRPRVPALVVDSWYDIGAFESRENRLARSRGDMESCWGESFHVLSFCPAHAA
jgi:predicted acyl esterase